MSDLIERQAAIDELYKMLHDCFWADDEELDAVITTLNDLPSAQPEPDEWCTDCKEYDKDKHCCPRWNRVIRQALKDTQPERKTEWISCDDKVPIVSGEFLVTLTDADGEWVSTAEWNTTFGGRWQDIFPGDGYRDISNVIAWMPLPAEYKERRGE